MDAALAHGVIGFEPVLEQLTSRIEEADEPEDLDLLAEVVREAPVEEATEMLARGMFIGELLGRMDALEDDVE